MKILADSSLPGLQAAFPYPFQLSTYDCNQKVPDLIQGQDILLCRSTLKVNKELIGDYSLQYVATASSGVDHIDKNFLLQQDITLIDAKGSNAVAVADYVLACLAWLDIHSFVKGNKVGIVGMGKVGSQVYQLLHTLGFEVVCFDPLKEHIESSFQSCPLESLLQCDILCIHAALHNEAPYPSYRLIDAHFLQCLKPHCIIINAARGGIIHEDALLQSQKPLIYATDVFANEPFINEQIIHRATLCTPHIAGHSKEAKCAAVTLVSKKLHEQLGLSAPLFIDPSSPPTLRFGLSWQKQVLSLYNPAMETAILKQAVDKKASFLSLRNQHIRYQFNLDTKLIPGIVNNPSILVN